MKRLDLLLLDTARRIGREQMAREVLAWVRRVGLKNFGAAPIGELVRLCRRAAK